MSAENQDWDMVMNIANIMQLRQAIWNLGSEYLTENISGYFIFKEMKKNIENIQRMRAEGVGLKANELLEKYPELLTIPEGLVMKYENFDPSLYQEKALFDLGQAKSRCIDFQNKNKSALPIDNIIKLFEKSMEELQQMLSKSTQGNSEQSGSER